MLTPPNSALSNHQPNNCHVHTSHTINCCDIVTESCLRFRLAVEWLTTPLPHPPKAKKNTQAGPIKLNLHSGEAWTSKCSHLCICTPSERDIKGMAKQFLPPVLSHRTGVTKGMLTAPRENEKS